MELYAGLDLHSRNTYIGILDDTLNRVFKKRVPNDLDQILTTLTPFKDRLKGFVVESTFNWYWLVDGLMEAGYGEAHLANPAAIKQYDGLKYSDDQHDAFFLAKLLILDILPEGYIYPKEYRPVRDLARKRMFLVQHKTANILSLKSLLQRSCSIKLSANDIQKLTADDLEEWLKEEYLVLTAKTSLDTITFLKEKIKCLEKAIIKRVKLRQGFRQLLTIPGIGNILAMTIMLEVGDIDRFPKVGNFVSYCRCVPSQRLSDGKSKGVGNRKNGNRYLSWAFTEAAQLGRRYNEQFRRYYNRKVAEANTSLATKALGNKLARICYYVMRDRVPFREELIAHSFGTAAVILTVVVVKTLVAWLAHRCTPYPNIIRQMSDFRSALVRSSPWLARKEPQTL